MDQRLIARPQNRVGVWTISVAQRYAVNGARSHEICMVAAREAAGCGRKAPAPTARVIISTPAWPAANRSARARTSSASGTTTAPPA